MCPIKYNNGQLNSPWGVISFIFHAWVCIHAGHPSEANVVQSFESRWPGADWAAPHSANPHVCYSVAAAVRVSLGSRDGTTRSIGFLAPCWSEPEDRYRDPPKPIGIPATGRLTAKVKWQWHCTTTNVDSVISMNRHQHRTTAKLSQAVPSPAWLKDSMCTSPTNHPSWRFITDLARGLEESHSNR
jgi:hypothetical protein